MSPAIEDWGLFLLRVYMRFALREWRHCEQSEAMGGEEKLDGWLRSLHCLQSIRKRAWIATIHDPQTHFLISWSQEGKKRNEASNSPQLCLLHCMWMSSSVVCCVESGGGLVLYSFCVQSSTLIAAIVWCFVNSGVIVIWLKSVLLKNERGGVFCDRRFSSIILP